MEFTRSFAILVTVVLAVIGTSGPGYPTHEERRPDQIKTSPSGLKYVADLDPGFLSISGSCPYQVNDAPVFESGDDASRRLADDDIVVGVRLRGIARAYPTSLLARPSSHIINDTADDFPFMVTWCPVCHSAVVFERPHVDRDVLEFATAGLYKRDLVMYDPQTLSLWLQITGVPVAGPLVGKIGRLHVLPADVVPWRMWKQAYPGSKVLVDWNRSGDPGRLAVYKEIARGSGQAIRQTDHRLPAKAIVVGIVVDRMSKAYLRETLSRTRLINDVVGGVAVLALHHPSSGEVKFFRRSVRNTEGLVFEMRDRKIVDKQTATVWNLDGVAESGPLKGRRLESIVSIPAFWFAWVTFYPKSELLK